MSPLPSHDTADTADTTDTAVLAARTRPHVAPADSHTRRDLLRYSAAIGAALVVTAPERAGADTPRQAPNPLRRQPAPIPGVVEVYINEGMVPMVDGSMAYRWGFGDRPTDLADPIPSLTISPRCFLADGSLVASRLYPPSAAAPPRGRPEPAGADPDHPFSYLLRRAHWGSYLPARTVIAETGARVMFRVHNRLREVHELAVLGMPGAAPTTGPIAPGGVATLAFDATTAGTYIYTDPTNGPVGRMLGLFGAVVVVPAEDRWRLSPGGVEFERQWLWICSSYDPVWGRRAQLGEAIDPVATPPIPRYFMLNDRSGYQAVAATRDNRENQRAYEDSLPSGHPRKTDVTDFSKDATESTVITGQLIRVANCGVAVHQLHFHGNHVWTVRQNRADLSRTQGTISPEGHLALQHWEDTVELHPLDTKELVHPFERPPDALDEVFEARTTDWHYPMHCHAEMSQTAAGGMYPGGLLADWTLAWSPTATSGTKS
ncbi:MAG: multicopper oxidase domain-containing protein [Acidimicrobiales bacterium]